MGKGSELLAGVVLGCFLCWLFLAVIAAIDNALEERKAKREEQNRLAKKICEAYEERAQFEVKLIHDLYERLRDLRNLIETYRPSHPSQVSEPSEPSDKSDKAESAAPAPARAQHKAKGENGR